MRFSVSTAILQSRLWLLISKFHVLLCEATGMFTPESKTILIFGKIPPEYQRRTLGAVQKMMSTAEGEIINSKEKEKKVEKREITERKNTF